MDREAWQAYSLWGHKELDMTEELSIMNDIELFLKC